MIKLNEAIKSAIWGFVVGDAIGVPYEFSSRTSMKSNPAKHMIGYGTHNQPPGTWSDDTSMMLCVLKNNLNNGDVKKLCNLFLEWYCLAKFTAHGKVFDIGNQTRIALKNLEKSNPDFNSYSMVPLDNIRQMIQEPNEYVAGNGSLMRCLPYAFGENYSELMLKMVLENKLTHNNSLCNTCCIFYTKMMRSIYDLSCTKVEALKRAKAFISYGWRIVDLNDSQETERKLFQRLFSPDFIQLQESDIKSSGYVLDTLEAVVWCFLNTENYKEAVLKAVNLGEDTDTIAALTGGLAGLYYGIDQIPKEWIDQIANKQLINNILSNN